MKEKVPKIVIRVMLELIRTRENLAQTQAFLVTSGKFSKEERKKLMELMQQNALDSEKLMEDLEDALGTQEE